MMFDPNFADQNLFETALRFDTFGITSSTMTLTGAFNFTTQPDDGYGFSGPASVVQQNQAGGLKSFLGQGAKYLVKVGNITKEVESLNKAVYSTGYQ